MSTWHAFFLGTIVGWIPSLLALVWVLWPSKPTIHDDDYEWDAGDLAPRGQTDVSKRPF